MRKLAITRTVSCSIGNCELTHLERASIDLERAREQHGYYQSVLRDAGWEVINLEEQPDMPDAVFVEDTAVILDGLAVIARPGASSRRRETASIANELALHLPVAHLPDNTRLDGGDVLVVGKHIFVGISTRTTSAGVKALDALASGFGYATVAVEVDACLHLKSAATAIDDESILLNPHLVDPSVFADFDVITTDPTEAGAANVVAIGSCLIHSAAFPLTTALLEAAGHSVISVPLDELAKAEGAATCCSLLLTNII